MYIYLKRLFSKGFLWMKIMVCWLLPFLRELLNTRNKKKPEKLFTRDYTIGDKVLGSTRKPCTSAACIFCLGQAKAFASSKRCSQQLDFAAGSAQRWFCPWDSKTAKPDTNERCAHPLALPHCVSGNPRLEGTNSKIGRLTEVDPIGGRLRKPQAEKSNSQATVRARTDLPRSSPSVEIFSMAAWTSPAVNLAMATKVF